MVYPDQNHCQYEVDAMNVNADFLQRVVIHPERVDWEPSPMKGVERRRLDRVAEPNDRVTTIVRYAPESRFSSHVHTGGEEFIVLEGIFEDDYGEWPAGSYIRNPPQSSHTPGSTQGCTIFVKLWQFQPDDRTFIHANRHKLPVIPHRCRLGVSIAPLYLDEHEYVRFEQWDPNTEITLADEGGLEVLVLDGECTQQGDRLTPYSWLRSPPAQQSLFATGPEGAYVWIKSGHLASLS